MASATLVQTGKPFPFFLGSPSRSILANLPATQLQRIYLNHADEIAEANLGKNWPAFREKMKAAREVGVVVASDIDKKLVGFGAPIFSSPDKVAASITLAKIKKEVSAEDIENL